MKALSFITYHSKFIISILSLFFTLTAFGQADSLGFTNRAEAKNLMVNGQKQGKWVEYIDADNLVTNDPQKAQAYRLIIYKEGHPYGVIREYNKSGKLNWQVAVFESRKISSNERPNLSITAEIDNIRGRKKFGPDFYQCNSDSLKSMLWVKVAITNNSNDTIHYLYSSCNGKAELFGTNVDFIKENDCIECAKTVRLHDTLFPHKPFTIMLNMYSPKTPQQLEGLRFKINFTCETRSGHGNWFDLNTDEVINNYWSNEVEIK